MIAVDPAAAQPWAGGGGQLNTTAGNVIPWAVRWLLIIGTVIGVAAHVMAGWTSNQDKAFQRKEWRNRALIGVGGAIPILIVLNGLIVAFGGEPLDFFPFI